MIDAKAGRENTFVNYYRRPYDERLGRKSSVRSPSSSCYRRKVAAVLKYGYLVTASNVSRPNVSLLAGEARNEREYPES